MHARGITVEPEGLPALLEEALGEMHRTLFPSDPAADLPAGETAALRRGGFELTPGKRERANALARAAADYAALLETSLAANDAARILGLDPSRIRQLLAARKIFGLQIKGVWSIPAFQFDGHRLLPGVEEVMPTLPRDLHPVAVYRWFTTPNTDLVPEDLDRELSPREWLLAGYSPKVVAQLGADLDNL
ncbi:MAG TPA: hypothetical protein VGR07_15420 [Thermoanaerobaculia bacterium]|nr:hypothetical protein [Thermoanaerobaculia bacterium]